MNDESQCNYNNQSKSSGEDKQGSLDLFFNIQQARWKKQL